MRLLLLIFFFLAIPCLALPESIEGFQTGGSGDEVITRLGEPANVEGPHFNNKLKTWTWVWDYPQYGALFEVEALSKEGALWVRSITIVSPCPWRLRSGASLGMTPARLEQLYPRFEKPNADHWFLTSKYSRYLVGFEFTNGRITSIHLGTRPGRRAH